MEVNGKLDGKYVCTKQTPKNEILSKINDFINQNPEFRPKAKSVSCGKDMVDYCKENGYVILDEYFLSSKIPQKLRDKNYYYHHFYTNDIAIVSDENKVKKIIVKRSLGKIKEISLTLSTNTLYMIWETFVKNVISYQYTLRKLKVLKDDIESFNLNGDDLYCIDNVNNEPHKTLTLISISNVKMDIYKRNVTFNKILYKYNQKESKFNVETVSNGIDVTLKTFNEMVNSYKNMNVIKISDLKERIVSRHENNIKQYISNFNESMSFINTLMIN